MDSSDYCPEVGNWTQCFACRDYLFTWPQCSNIWGLYTGNQCLDYEGEIEKHLEAPMPWIGMYIASASAVCTLAMAADAFNGFRTKKSWFPCKYFALNAFPLTVLTIAMKLTVDLTTSMRGVNDKIATVSSLVMLSTAIGNFMTSLATMDNNEILLNLTALGILVITIATNVFIHNAQTSDNNDGQVVLAEETMAAIFMLLLLLLLCSSAVVIPTTTRYLEAMYFEMHKIASNEGANVRDFANIVELRVLVKTYWVMVETGSPQFVMARSVISIISGTMCLLMALTLVEAHVRMPLLYSNFARNTSSYRSSTNWILYIQSAGVALRTIAPLLRGFLVIGFWSLNCADHCRNVKKILKIDAYWTQMLVGWRESSLPLQIRHYKYKRILHDVKWLLLTVCIGIQTTIIFTSKLLLLFSAAALSCFRPSNDTEGLESEVDFSRFVLLLEGEPQLPKKIWANICNEADDLSHMGRKQKPNMLIKFLSLSQNFNGVKEFDSLTKVRSLHSRDQEPPNCWSLTVVTLTSIAIAISSSTISFHNKVKQLVSSVSEGLSFVNSSRKLSTQKEN